MILFLLIPVAIIGFYILYRLKRLRYGNLTLITGGVKTGKTQLAVALCIKQYRRQLGKWRRACRRSRRRYLPLPEKPLLYSNMPIGKKGQSYAVLTADHLSGKVRFRGGSVIYFNETSLIAGSKDIKNEDLNDQLLQFFKLVAHFTAAGNGIGGYAILDTQSPQDCHYTIKRSLSTYYMIYRRFTLPFISFVWLREQIFVDGEHSVAIDSNIDPDDSLLEGGKKMYFRPILNKWWKYYDRYAYSSLVEKLPVGLDEQGRPLSEPLQVVVSDQKVSVLLRCKDILSNLKKVGDKRDSDSKR